MSAQQDILHRLQREILQLQGSRPPAAGQTALDLGPIQTAFPNNAFPAGAIHEFICPGRAEAAATSGFMAGIMSGLMRTGGVSVWVGVGRTIYPPGLKAFGIAPDRIIFMDMRNEKEVLWVMEEALKCEGLATVVGQIRDMGMTVSRRYQLAVEQSRVTGLVLRQGSRQLQPNAAVARWQIKHSRSITDDGMPGVGHFRWKVDLLRIRNGHPGSWEVGWQAGRFHFETAQVRVHEEIFRRRTG